MAEHDSLRQLPLPLAARVPELNSRESASIRVAENALASLEQITPGGRVKRVQASLPAVTAAELATGDPELDLTIAGRLMRDATAVYLDPGAAQPSSLSYENSFRHLV